MIQVRDLAKYFGETRALGPVSFDIADGETVGFLGLNGAGKTTVLRILACDLRPSSGSVRVGDIDAILNPHEVRKLVGFLPESPPVYPDMTVGDYLAFAGRLRGMTPGEVDQRLPEVERVTHVDTVHDELIRNLSHGYRQRVGVAQAIVHNPRLLILDEPTRGLDPVQIVEMREMVRSLKQAHTVLISSHILPEISETCDRILVLGQGEIVASGTERSLADELVSSRRLLVGVLPGEGSKPTAYRGVAGNDPVAILSGVKDVSEVVSVGQDDDGAHLFEVGAAADVRAAVTRALVEAGHGVVRLERPSERLESIFMQLVKGGPSARS